MKEVELWAKFQTVCWNCGVIDAVDPLTVEETHEVFCKDCNLVQTGKVGE